MSDNAVAGRSVGDVRRQRLTRSSASKTSVTPLAEVLTQQIWILLEELLAAAVMLTANG